MVHTEKFSEGALVELLMDCNVKYPYIVLAQAKLESGNFTSKIFKQNNNMFGMRKARRRITSSQSEKNTYAYYRDWVDCVYDYAMYQSNVMCDVTSENQYFDKLSARYAEDSTYVSKLKDIIDREKLKTIFEE
jgi:flagellum-specific peptidoglycan hydrolase FlgJ